MLSAVRRALLPLAAFALIGPAFGWNQWTWTSSGPGQRAAHSLHVFKNKAYLFGGRSDDVNVPHTPKTYKIIETDGVLSFAGYDTQSVTTCENETDTSCLRVWKGLLHNDVWSYQLGSRRYSSHFMP